MILRRKKKIASILVAMLIAISLMFSACSFNSQAESTASSTINLYSSDKELAAMVDKATSIKEYSDYKDEDYQSVKLNGNSIAFDGTGAEVNGTDLTIKEPGTYVISGTLDDGSIIVDSEAEDNVTIVLNNANITCKDGSVISVKECGKNVVISLPDGTENTMTDGSSYQTETTTDTTTADTSSQPSAAIYSTSDLRINGTGTLTVNGKYNDGITSKDDVEITQATLIINAADDGIVGKDSVAIGSGNITINAEGDGIKSTNSEDTAKGYVVIADGAFKLKTGNDGIQAENTLLIVDGTYDITTGDGADAAVSKSGMGGGTPPSGNGGGNMTPPDRSSSTTSGSAVDTPNRPQRSDGAGGGGQPPQMQQQNNSTVSSDSTETESESMKALKAGTRIIIQDGNFTIDSQDDALHSNGTLATATAEFKIAAGDDGMHADTSLDIYGGVINITKSYEGIESAKITINDGKITVVASDDGINVAGASDSNSMGGPQQDTSSTESNESAQTLTINGGTIYVNASGDGLDMNGSGHMTGGTVTVSGPTNDGNGALDYDGEFVVTGGTLLVAGSSGMAQAPSTGSTVYTIATDVDTQAAGTEVCLVNSEGKTILSYTPEKEYSNIVISSSLIQSGESYKIMTGDTELASFTADDVVTNLSSKGNGGGMMPQGGRDRQQTTSSQTTTSSAVTTQSSKTNTSN